MDDATRRLVNRWRSIAGHARGVERMLAEEAYCIDILKQTLAIQGAIEKVNAAILERHLQTCVAAAIRSDDLDERERVIRELLEVMKGTGHLRRVASTGDVLESVAEALGGGEAIPPAVPMEAGPT